MLAIVGPLGWPEIIALLVLALLVFGNRLPRLAREMGRAIVSSKKGITNLTDQITHTDDSQSPR